MLSVLVLVVGLAPVVMKGSLPLGIDFSGGTIVVVRFAEHVGEEVVRRSLDSVSAEKIVQQYGDAADNTLMIRLPQMVGDEEGANLEEGANAVMAALEAANFVGYELSLNVVAGLLTITGYSVNDTIVVFDRVRENFRSMRRDLLEQVINRSVNQTLGRTVITSVTTALAVLSLLLYGGEVLNGFAFTMLVGILSGTYSTVFIAASVAILLGGRKQKARSTLPLKTRKPGRKVQVS